MVGRGDELVVLGRYDDGVYAHGTVLLVVFDRNLRFGIGTQIRHFVLFSAYHCQLAQQQVREVERERHVVVGFVTGVTEHHSLISGTLIHGLGTFYSPVDVGRLLVYGREYSAGVAVEFIFAACVPDAVDDAAGDFVQVDVSTRFYFTGEDDLPGGYQCFASDFRLGVVSEKFVEQGVGNLIGHLVGVSFRYRFGGKQIVHFLSYFTVKNNFDKRWRGIKMRCGFPAGSPGQKELPF